MSGGMMAKGGAGRYELGGAQRKFENVLAATNLKVESGGGDRERAGSHAKREKRGGRCV